MLVTFENREVDIELEGATMNYDDWCDVFISSAYWQDTDTELTDEEYDRINDKLQSGDVSWIERWVY